MSYKQSELFPVEGKSAVISECGTYRYLLTRLWQPGPMVTFVGLNPSTADGETDDPTIRKCRHFAKRFGYGGLFMVNLFAYRATSPADMKRAAHPVGPENARHVREAIAASSLVICAWGRDGAFLDQDRVFMDMVREEGYRLRLTCLGVNQDGTPKHPLYLANDTALRVYGGRS